MTYNRVIDKKLQELLKLYWFFTGLVIALVLGVNIYFVLKKPADIATQVQDKLTPLPSDLDFKVIDRVVEYEENLPLKIEAFEDIVEAQQ